MDRPIVRVVRTDEGKVAWVQWGVFSLDVPDAEIKYIVHGALARRRGEVKRLHARLRAAESLARKAMSEGVLHRREP